MNRDEDYAAACLNALLKRDIPIMTIARKTNIPVGELRELVSDSNIGRCNKHLIDLRREYSAMPGPVSAKVRFLD